MKPCILLILILLVSCKKEINDQAVFDFLIKTVPELTRYTNSLLSSNRKPFYQLEFYPDSNPEHPGFYQIAIGESSPIKNTPKYRFLVNSQLSEILFFDFIADTLLPLKEWLQNYYQFVLITTKLPDDYIFYRIIRSSDTLNLFIKKDSTEIDGLDKIELYQRYILRLEEYKDLSFLKHFNRQYSYIVDGIMVYDPDNKNLKAYYSKNIVGEVYKY